MINMQETLRIQKKILKYSYLFKMMGIISEEEFQKIAGKYHN